VPPTRRAVETSREEPVAFTKLKEVIVPVVERRVEKVPFVEKRFVPVAPVKRRSVAKRFVVVTEVPVAEVKVRPCNDVVPVAVMFEVVRPP
jgi:hypothetical protein